MMVNRQIQYKTVILGASFKPDEYGFRGKWDMPAPMRYDLHWKSRGMRIAAEKMGLNVLNAGTPYTTSVPIYRGVANSIYRIMKNKARRASMGRWVN